MSRRKHTYSGGDPRTREARARGYPARSVFKLEEIDRRVKLLRRGQRVLDLGAAPGSWSRYASERVGPSGRVVAIDLQVIDQPFGRNVIVLQGDALVVCQALTDAEVRGADQNPASELLELGPYDIVLSDMAPSTSGSKVRDQALSHELLTSALQVAAASARAGSSFVGKLFMGPDFEAARKDVAVAYDRCTVIRPSGTRQQSSEVFLVGLGRR